MLGLRFTICSCVVTCDAYYRKIHLNVFDTNMLQCYNDND